MISCIVVGERVNRISSDVHPVTFTAILRVAAGGQGLRLSKDLLSDADIDVGDAVDVAVHKGALIVTPLRRVRGGHDLRALVGRISKKYKPEELAWGPPVGREVW
jgi:antitoxin MazE